MTKQLSRLTLALQSDAPVDRTQTARLGPHLHGVLMDAISGDYAETLHNCKVNPYSQCALGRSSTVLDWHVRTLTSEAGTHIVEPLVRDSFSGFRLRSVGLSITVTRRTVEKVPLSELSRAFYAPPETNRFRVSFLTPTAFKQAGEYVFWPDPRLVFQSLAQKYCAIVDDDEPEEGLIDEFGRAIRLTSYRVMSQQFIIGAARVPGFTGYATFTIKGADCFTSYVAVLLRFGEFSGCGIKSSLGMGAMQVDALPRSRKDLPQ
ncbi:CRISPR-associated endoribonuclease Cas6 [Mycobacterium sp. SM1]|uniref:CRISPR-associated endoribonuclease Cas6 n=1 Tax=Mycobacterium sp. SM1 TaxID=2816243 RepID=UPI001BCC4F92|nr:CRISPR-associated endoribonuclease Cas6 [Mycobacterium sp. SM1]MBS4728524.1 CRISPR-associated endoribonuclease Cas6 [Mycobacterium sp. SM1]